MKSRILIALLAAYAVNGTAQASDQVKLVASTTIQASGVQAASSVSAAGTAAAIAAKMQASAKAAASAVSAAVPAAPATQSKTANKDAEPQHKAHKKHQKKAENEDEGRVATGKIEMAPVQATELPPENKPELIGLVMSKPSVKKRHKEILPGVGTYEVNDRLTHGSTVKATTDGTEIVMLSNRFPNRIVTPFEHAKVIELANAPYSTQVIGSSVYVSTNSTEPFSMFITGSDQGDQVVSLTVMPKDIPTQVISVQMDSPQQKKRDNKENGYEQKLMDLLRTVAMGKTPDGFSEAVMPNLAAQERRDGLSIVPVKRYSGAYLDVYKYEIDNNQQTVELAESSFYQKGVRAVSIFPRVILRRGESTYVYVVADKSVLDNGEAQ